LYATTKTFLDDLALRSLEELPALTEPGTEDGQAASLVPLLEQKVIDFAQTPPPPAA
jgi:hypothetical protein